ncbi:cytochrome b5-related protein-like [Anticarsia gemmatalis]|uniref:cytochrome b5-related protein-like n=1 Tax=Anticarsia gemmatalis TaxID=129554 RepID=UPI003F763CD4
MAPKGAEYIEFAHRKAAEKKTHVSFPQLKYPSLRDEGLRHPVQWLQGKALDDGAEGLWRVHDGIYDLTEFIDKHPGGADWLELTKGTDITEAFECHHITNFAVKMLEKFHVRDAKTPRNSPFTFKEDGFYKTLKREAVEELKKLPKTEGNKTDRIIDGLFGTLLVTSVLSLWLTNYWAVMASYLIASLSLAWTAVAAHNYLHRRTNWRMYLFNLTLWSYRDFRVSHALSHHLYPNTLMDLEVSGLEPFLLWNPRKKPFYAKLTLLIELALFPALFIITFLKRFSLNFTREGFFKNHYKWHDGVGFLLPLWMYIMGGASFYDTIVMWLWINCTASFIFFSIGSNAAHHHPQIFKDGDQVRETTVDWGMHELEAVMDRTDINGNLFKVMTFFGDHAMHHLFPTVDHAYLSHLYPIFLRNCQKFKANFRMTSSIDLFIGQLKTAVKVDPNVLEDSS